MTVNAVDEIFATATDASGFWLPALLENLVTFVPTLTNGDGGSIFVRVNGEQEIHLAATTRPTLKAYLFDRTTSYVTNEQALRWAAKQFKEEGATDRAAGLTGWVAAFNHPLNLRDLLNADERTAYETPDRPLPVWSDRARSFYDWEGKRPFLVVPMTYKGVAHGAIRAYALREKASAFDSDAQQRLQEFANRLAAFLVDRNILTSRLRHYCRIWAAPEGKELARRITAAVPPLFGVDCCSFFVCDEENQFVLRHTARAEGLSADDCRHFESFAEENLDRLFYRLGGRSKTNLCINRKEAFLLKRDENRRWQIVLGPAGGVHDLAADGRRFFLPSDRPDPEVDCELHPARSESILLVPVRDLVNTRMLAAVLRVVSLEREDVSSKTLLELRHFSEGLAGRLGESTRQQIQHDSAGKLIRELGSLRNHAEKWSAAARIVAGAVEADAVTIFRHDGSGVLRATPDSTYLNIEQIQRDQPPPKLDLQQRTHRDFRQFVGSIEYSIGEGRTGRPGADRRVLNLRDSMNEANLRALGITPRYPRHCEIAEVGPFLAAPMARGPDDRLDGVVRALRWRNSPLGPFSTSHETILAYCATILASLLRVWDPRPEPTVVISYGNATLKDHLVRFLNVIGVKSLHLGDTACGGIPNAYFEDLVQRAHAGIAIAVPARRGSRGAAQHEPSLNVAHEIGQMISRFPGRLLVLKEQRCDYAMGGNIGRVLEFSMAEGIFRRMTDVAAALREWGLIGNPSVD